MVDFRIRIKFMIILMIMNDSKRWRTLIKRLAYLRAEAAESVESFEESVKEIEKSIDEKQESSQAEKDEKIDGKIPVIDTSMIKFSGVQSSNSGNKSEEKRDTSAETPIDTNQETKDEEDDLKSHYKKLWRVIARLTHPDAVGNNEELVALYKAAASAYERDKREELLDVASEVNVHLDNPHPTMISDLNRRCSHYEGMIRKIRDSVAWKWKNAQEGTKKEIIDLIKSRRAEKKTTN